MSSLGETSLPSFTEKLLVYPWKDTLPQTFLGHLISFQDVGSLEALAPQLDLHSLKPARSSGLKNLKPKIPGNTARNLSTPEQEISED